METRRQALYEIVAEQQPMTVRQVFYRAMVKGVVEKTEDGYRTVQRALVEMRRVGVLPYEWISDNTRWMRKPQSHQSLDAAMRDAARLYRKDLWVDADAYVEVWCEKDALAGVLSDITYEFDVPLMVARGFASETYLNEAAMSISQQDRPCYVYHFGDHDPSGVEAAKKIQEGLCRLAPKAEIHFMRAAVTPDQIAGWNLPTRPTKATDSRFKKWAGGESVELDAIEPDMLRLIAGMCIERHLPREEMKRLRLIEAGERQTFEEFAEAWRRRPK
jgi:hypothetical protein